MPFNIRIVTTYPPRRCGIGTFSRDLANALEHFTGEIGHIRVAAIDLENLPYSIPVDLVIKEFDPQSWQYAIKDIITRAEESVNATVVLLQHEYGLDPDDDGNACQGTNYVKMAKAFSEKGLITLVYLHTVLEEPDVHQRRVLQELAQYSDGLIVTTESAVELLESKRYSIPHGKLKHIDHGIRMQHPSMFDRLEIKKQLGLQDTCLATTSGLLSPGKGIEYGIRGYGRFLEESMVESQRQHMLYLIAGQCHPEFVKAEDGQPYREYMDGLHQALEESKVRWCKVRDLGDEDLREYDVVFLDNFLDERMLLKLYGATNMMILPYLNMEQMSSGILADTLGAGRVAIATKFRYALELINSNRPCDKGVVMGRHTRGILVDPGPDSVEQIAEAIDHLVFHKDRRLRMEKQAHQRGYQMRWTNSAWALIQMIEFIAEEKEIVSGRGISFSRERRSIYQRTRVRSHSS